jgi:hypothetical protein
LSALPIVGFEEPPVLAEVPLHLGPPGIETLKHVVVENDDPGILPQRLINKMVGRIVVSHVIDDDIIFGRGKRTTLEGKNAELRVGTNFGSTKRSISKWFLSSGSISAV